MFETRLVVPTTLEYSMQGQNQQQVYDRGTTIFSPDGRLYQVEYAREAIKRGTTSVGVRTVGGVVLVADKPARSPLIERSSVEKLHKIDDHVGIASAGHVADARTLVDFAREQAQVNQLRYGETIDIEPLTKSVTDHIQEFTQSGGARPFGVALLIGGVEDGTARLYETDPSGTPYEWKATAIGGESDDVRDYLEEHYHEDADLMDSIDLALRALASIHDGVLDPEQVGVATVDTESERFNELAVSEIETHLAEFDLSDDDGPTDPDEEGE